MEPTLAPRVSELFGRGDDSLLRECLSSSNHIIKLDFLIYSFLFFHVEDDLFDPNQTSEIGNDEPLMVSTIHQNEYS